MTEQQIRETYFSRVLLDCDSRLFYCDDEIKTTYTKGFNQVHPDIKMLQFANDKFGMTSDCYILYAIGHLGCATKDAIVEFLSAIAKKTPSLRILTTKEAINERIRYMYGLGLVMRFNYDAYVGKDRKKERMSLYVITDDGLTFVKQHLKKRCTLNAGFYAKHIRDLIGWGCAASLGAHLANLNAGFLEFSDGILRTKQMGALFFPCEWKAEVEGVRYYVSFMPSYLEFDKSYLTERDYDVCCMMAVNTIRNYINCRTQKGIPVVVIVVEDNKDLNNIALNIMASGALNEMLDHIFFTGEGAVKGYKENAKSAFYKLQLDATAKEGYSICACRAPFIA